MVDRKEITGYSFSLNKDGTYTVKITTKDNVISCIKDSVALRDLIIWIERSFLLWTPQPVQC